VSLSGTPVLREEWIVTIGVIDVVAKTPVTVFSYTVADSGGLDTLEDIADELATLISADSRFSAAGDGTDVKITFDDTTQYYAEADGSALTIVSTASPLDEISISETITRAPDVVTLSGTPIEGETWTIVVDGTPYSRVVAPGPETLAQIATELATAINAAIGFSATDVGETVEILSDGDAPFTLSVEIDPDLAADPDDDPGEMSIERPVVDGLAAVAAVDTLADIAAAWAGYINADDRIGVVTLGGTVAGGEDWTITIGVESYTVTTDGVIDTLEEIAADLESQINTAALFSATALGSVLSIDLPASGFKVVSFSISAGAGTSEISVPYSRSAAAEGETLFIANSDAFAAAFATAVTIEPNGSEEGVAADTAPAPTSEAVTLVGNPAPGEVWTIAFDGLSYEHTVLAGEALADVAAILAAQIDADTAASAVDYSAAASGATIFIVNRVADPITPSPTVSVSTINFFDTLPVTATVTFTDNDPTAIEADDPEPGETWTVDVAGTDYSYVVKARATITMTGPLVDDVWTATPGEAWTLTIGALTPYTIIIGGSYDTGSGAETVDTLEKIAAAFAVMIASDGAAADYTATATGEILSVVSDTNTPFVTTAEITPVSQDTAVIFTGGVPVAGDVYNLTIVGLATYSVTAGDNYDIGGTLTEVDTAEEIAGALAQAILDAALANYAVVVDGTRIELSNTLSAPFTANVSIDRVPGSLTGAIEVTDPSTDNAMVVLTGDTREDVAIGLAAAIELGGVYEATAQGVQLIVANPAAETVTVTLEDDAAGSIRAASYAQSLTVSLAGTPLAGETWNLSLETQVYDAAAGEFVTVTQTFSYDVSDADGSVDTLAEIAAGLVAGSTSRR
jgi:hypothetical protein